MKDNREGFSLIEVMVALSILALGLVGTMSVQDYRNRTDRLSFNSNAADNMAWIVKSMLSRPSVCTGNLAGQVITALPPPPPPPPTTPPTPPPPVKYEIGFLKAVDSSLVEIPNSLAIYPIQGPNPNPAIPCDGTYGPGQLIKCRQLYSFLPYKLDPTLMMAPGASSIKIQSFSITYDDNGRVFDGRGTAGAISDINGLISIRVLNVDAPQPGNVSRVPASLGSAIIERTIPITIHADENAVPPVLVDCAVPSPGTSPSSSPSASPSSVPPSSSGLCGRGQYSKGTLPDGSQSCGFFSSKDYKFLTASVVKDPSWCSTANYSPADWSIACPDDYPEVTGIVAESNPITYDWGFKVRIKLHCWNPNTKQALAAASEPVTPWASSMPCMRNENFIGWGNNQWDTQCPTGQYAGGIAQQYINSKDITPQVLCREDKPDGSYTETPVAGANASAIAIPYGYQGNYYGNDGAWGNYQNWKGTCPLGTMFSGIKQVGGAEPVLICRMP